MKIYRNITILIISFILFAIFPLIHSNKQISTSSVTKKSSEIHQFTLSINEMNILDLPTGLDCDDFQGPVKRYILLETFYWTWDSNTLHYGIYLGVMFAKVDSSHKNLVFYAFVITLDEYYISSYSMTFNFDLSGSYNGVAFNETGSKSDQAAFWTSDPCLYQFPLFAVEVEKSILQKTLTISLTYLLTGADVNEPGSYVGSTQIAAITTLDFIFLVFIIIASCIGGLITTIVVIRKRREKRSMDRIPKHWAFAKSQPSGGEGTVAASSVLEADTRYEPTPETSSASYDEIERESESISSFDLLGEESGDQITAKYKSRRESPPPAIYSEEEIDNLLNDLKYGIRYTRLKAIDSLGKSGNKSAVPAIVDILLHENDTELRSKAALCLGLIGDTDTLPILRRLLNEDPDPEVRNSVADAIDLIKGFEDL